MNRKSQAIWDSVHLLRKAHCSDLLYKNWHCDSSGDLNRVLSLDIFRWGRGLPHEGVGTKKFGMLLETREIKLFWRDIPIILPGYPGGAPEKFERKKSLGSIFVS